MLKFRCGSRVVIALGAVVVAACQQASDRAFIVASLRPVDSARAMVVFSQVQGRACGADAVLGAIRDMKRLNDIDGYLEVVVQQTGTGDKLCAKATAYPFRYGTSTSTPVIRVADESVAPVLVPGRALAEASAGGSAATAPFDCAAACRRYAELATSGSVQTALVKDRCEQRCKQPDTAFQACIAGAADADAAKACASH